MKPNTDVFVNGTPYRLLTFKWKCKGRQCWLAVPLFVSNNPVELVIHPCDHVHVSRLHGQAKGVGV